MKAIRKGNVLLVANFPSDVGYAWWLMENFWSVIAREVAAQGRSCYLAYPRIAAVPDAIRESPVTLVEIDFNPSSSSERKRGMELIRKERIKSIYLSDWPPTHWIYAMWRAAGVRRIVVHAHSGGEGPKTVGTRAVLKRALHAVRLFSADVNVAPSPYMERRLGEVGCVPAKRRRVVTNGIRLFSCKAVNRDLVRQRIGVASDAILICLVSRVTYLKGIDFAIRALARLLSEESLRGKLVAVHCGDGPDLPAFEKLASDLGVTSQFRFLGHRNDVREILCASDIALHPSRTEAMSLAILEFLSAGLAVVTSDLPSVSSAIQRGTNGLTYKFDDLDDAVSVLRHAIVDPALRSKLGKAAIQSCTELYNLETMNRTFLATVVPEL